MSRRKSADTHDIYGTPVTVISIGLVRHPATRPISPAYYDARTPEGKLVRLHAAHVLPVRIALGEMHRDPMTGYIVDGPGR